MPLYEYECKKCKHRFERIQKFADEPVKKCPQCGGPVERLISPPAVQFKGSGWYVTDYARKSSSSREDGKPAEPTSGEDKAAKPEKEKAETSSKSDSKKSSKK